MKTALRAVVLACVVVSVAASQEPGTATPSELKVADAVPGAISPDGRLLSYTDFSTGDLVVQDLTTGQIRSLTHKTSWLESSEFAEAVQAISRDGEQLAYAWHTEGTCDLRIVELDGGEPRVVYRDEELRCIEPQDWSADGQRILATFLRKDGTGETVLVSVRDGSVRTLPTLDSTSLNMTFSPDGRWIVYDFRASEGSPERDIHVLSSDGSRGFPLVEHAADDFVLGWAPDGKRVVFASDRAGTFGAWTVAVDDGVRQGTPELLRPDIPHIRDSWLGLTRDGSYYYGRQSGWEGDVYLAALDAATGRARTPEALVGGVGRDTFADWSPDGRSLLAQGRSIRGDAVFRIDADTGEAARMLLMTGGMEWPVWSPDGTAIAYRRLKSDPPNPLGEQSLVIRDLESGRERELYRGNAVRIGSAEPTGPAEPSETAFPTNGGYQGASNLAISADGRWLAFVWSEWSAAGRSSTALKVVSTLTGGETRELLRVQSTARILQPAWMPDGRHLLFGTGRMEDREPSFELWRIAADGGAPESLGLSMEGHVMYGLSVHPDGQRIAFTVARPGTGPETWVMKNLAD